MNPSPNPLASGEDGAGARQRIVAISPDGVTIVGNAAGDGPGIALVYGAMMEQEGWSRLVPLLAGHTVYTYDRRGRGESTDAPVHTPRAEVDDLLAFVGALPQPLDVFGHSSGALLVLQAMTQGLPARRLVLYEPILAGLAFPQVPVDLSDRVQALVAAGDPDAALELFMRNGMSLSGAELERARASSRWTHQMRYVHTAAYDSRIARTYSFDPERLAQIRVPVLLLAGSESPAWMRESVDRFAEALPNARVEVLDGHGHNAQFTGPDLLAAKIRAFLDPGD